MLCLALLLVLPLAAVCIPTPEQQQQETLMILETMYKPCILHKQYCPLDGSMDYAKFEPQVRQLLQLKPPTECNCDLSTEGCNRRCYYAYMKKMYLMSAAAGKTDLEEIARTKALMTQQLEQYYKPCILQNRNCQVVGGLTYSKISSEVATYMKMTSLPEECDCDADTESCIRQCYFAYVKKMAMSAPASQS